MRKFYIENEMNARFSLWGNRVYMVDPDGLGVRHESSYIRIGHAFLRNKRNIEQAEIGGKIEFLDPGANEKFVEFYNFCAAATQLYLVYDPGDGTEYIRDIDITEVGKTERTGGTLPISINFACKSLYYLRNNKRFTFEPTEGEKIYDYNYDFRYGDYSSYSAPINNNGHVAAPFECTIFGYCVNPKIQIMRDKDVLYDVLFPVVVDEGEYIKYCSRDGMLEATLHSKSGAVNLMPLLDIRKDNFFKIPIGTSTITYKADNASNNVIDVTIYKMYEVV